MKVKKILFVVRLYLKILMVDDMNTILLSFPKTNQILL